MIGALRYFASRMFAPRYWPKDGATASSISPISGIRTVVVPLETRTIVVRTE
jgi:hypothetical protein